MEGTAVGAAFITEGKHLLGASEKPIIRTATNAFSSVEHSPQ
jgi:hypothetical protein